MRISIAKGVLKVRFSKSETFLAIKRTLKIRLDGIRRVHAKPPKTVWNELKAPGSFFPGLVKAGTYYTPRGKEFWCIVRGSKPVVLELKGEKYKRVVLGVKDNKAWMKKLGH